jgi:hypothetical protein
MVILAPDEREAIDPFDSRGFGGSRPEGWRYCQKGSEYIFPAKRL